ncbi:MAG: TIGR02757 family protein [Bacteroidales bacterium]
MASLTERSELKTFLDRKVLEFNRPEFLADDPIQIPHRFAEKADIEIAGFLTAILAWGNRKSILKSAGRLMERLDHAPSQFVIQHSDRDLKRLEGFVHRTFNSTDLLTFVVALKALYANHGGLEGVFAKHQTDHSLQPAVHQLKEVFFQVPHLPRTRKHLPDPFRGSAAKRINMFLRWMVRRDAAGVDFGIWEEISPARLSCPLDVHSGRVARKLGLLTRPTDDARAVEELDTALRQLDPMDPVKYDFALFGLGASGW